MADLKTNIEILSNVVDNPRAQLDKYLAAGKKVIGCFPMYVPEELVHAAGMIPMGLWGAQTELMLAKTYFPAFVCPIMQSCLELGLRGSYDGISAVIIPTSCDVFRNTTQNWKSGVKIPMIAFGHAQNRKNEMALSFMMDEYSSIMDRMEAITGLRATDESLAATIEVYNDHSAAIMEFVEVCRDHLDVITPNVRHIVMKSGMLMEKSEHTAIVREIIDGLKALPVHEWTGKKVILTGVTAEPAEFLEIFETCGLAVVGDDLGQESRQYRTFIPEDGTPLERVCKQWLNRKGCSLVHDPEKYRGQMLIDMCKETGADGVVVCMMKFCDPEEYDYPVYIRQFQEAGVPWVYIDIDQQSTSQEQARTRLQSFSEMI